MGNRPVKQKINIVLMVVFIYVNCLLQVDKTLAKALRWAECRSFVDL